MVEKERPFGYDEDVAAVAVPADDFQKQCDDAQAWCDLFCPQDDQTRVRLLSLVNLWLSLPPAGRAEACLELTRLVEAYG